MRRKTPQVPPSTAAFDAPDRQFLGGVTTEVRFPSGRSQVVPDRRARSQWLGGSGSISNALASRSLQEPPLAPPQAVRGDRSPWHTNRDDDRLHGLLKPGPHRSEFGVTWCRGRPARLARRYRSRAEDSWTLWIVRFADSFREAEEGRAHMPRGSRLMPSLHGAGPCAVRSSTSTCSAPMYEPRHDKPMPFLHMTSVVRCSRIAHRLTRPRLHPKPAAHPWSRAWRMGDRGELAELAGYRNLRDRVRWAGARTRRARAAARRSAALHASEAFEQVAADKPDGGAPLDSARRIALPQEPALRGGWRDLVRRCGPPPPPAVGMTWAVVLASALVARHDRLDGVGWTRRPSGAQPEGRRATIPTPEPRP